MEIIIEHDMLTSILKTHKGLINHSSLYDIPSSILFEVTDNQLITRSTNTISFVTTKYVADNNRLTIIKEGKILIPYHILTSFLSNEAKRIKYRIKTDDTKLQITEYISSSSKKKGKEQEKAKMTVAGLNPDMFPNIPSPEAVNTTDTLVLSLDRDIINSISTLLLPIVVKKDNIFSTVLITPTGQIVATNSYILAILDTSNTKRTKKLKKLSQPVTLSFDVVSFLAQHSELAPFTLHINQNYVLIHNQDNTLEAIFPYRQVKWPDWEKLLYSKSDGRFVVYLDELVPIINRITTLADNTNNLIELRSHTNLLGKELEVSYYEEANGKVFTDYKETLPLLNDDVLDISIAFNIHVLKTHISLLRKRSQLQKQLKGARVEFLLLKDSSNEQPRPIIIRLEDDKGFNAVAVLQKVQVPKP